MIKLKVREDIYKISIFIILLVFAITRIKYNDSTVVNFVNINSCLLAIITVILDSMAYFEKNDWRKLTLVVLLFVFVIFFGLLDYREYVAHIKKSTFISPSCSDALSILAFGISFSYDVLARILKCLLNWFNNIYEAFAK